eukprot:TRINITY_DN10924_c1_g1_i1.p1 TRINITY_DN10924_c1_g1~~TRINITY_DN10924_c1_g1_i1.p1  ORF type:complete len:819 (+),score=306.82 TRINITY_DN10924_c1_g1_i1:210-2459(+)
MDALKHASNMICELRTSLLGPKNYYALYIEANDQLRYLESYLLEEKHGKRMAELYELVQYAGNILPRLYLLITVGSVYIKLKEAPAKDVLRDLVEMCRGVQHPTRGLFLRTYLSEMVKDKLPDKGSEYEGRGGSTKDAIDFVLQNFIEMNKLWVRMQHQGPVRDREKREAERSDLRLLVGKNIARLSQLDGVDIDFYTKTVLPRLVEQIVNCRDVIAQQYLMECIIQAFPDDYHLRTLESILTTCGQLQPAVNIKSILVSLIDRLANFASSNPIPDDIQIFDIFSTQVARVVEQQKSMATEDILALEASLLNLAITTYPNKLEYVDTVFGFCSKVLEDRKEDVVKPAVVKQILRLLQIPLDVYKNILTVLKLSEYTKLISNLNYENRKRVALDITKNAIEFAATFSTMDEVNTLLGMIEPLIKDTPDQPAQIDDEDMEEEQHYVASLVHLFDNEDLEQLFGMYMAARKHFTQGGPKRIKHTLTPLVFRTLKLAVNLKTAGSLSDGNPEDSTWAPKVKKVLKFVHELVTELSKKASPELSLRLYLQCAQAANKCGAIFETIAYEFLTQAFMVYEENIADSQSQLNCLTLIIGTLQLLDNFTEENYDTLTTKTALHASKLLKKPDQCRAIIMVSHLFWCPNREYKNGKRVLECLQRALKIANTCVDTNVNVNLFVEILNECLYYFEKDCDQTTAEYLTGLIKFVNGAIANIDTSNGEVDTAKITSHFAATQQFIQWKKETKDPRYDEIEIK